MQSMVYRPVPIVTVIVVLLSTITQASQKTKPVLFVEKDGFPSGHGSPEGVACDLNQSFIKHDIKRFEDACIKPFTGGASRKAYDRFLISMIRMIEGERGKTVPNPGEPKSILKVYAVRGLSKDGPASYGYSAFGFKNVEFVDIAVTLNDGKQVVRRTLVIQDASGKWYAHPDPYSSPLLCDGLTDETASKKDIGDVYTLKKH